MKHTYKLFGLFLFLSFMGIQTTSAHAACSNPAGVEGEQIYNDDNNVMQFCDGTDWTAMKGRDLSTLDAATLDTLDSLQFLRSDVGDTATGNLTFQGQTNFQTHVNDSDFIVQDTDKGSVSAVIWYDHSAGRLSIGNTGGSGTSAEVRIRGQAELDEEGTAANHLVTKGYVDTAVSGAGGDNLGAGGSGDLITDNTIDSSEIEDGTITGADLIASLITDLNDADTLDGYDSAIAATPNTVVVRDAQGDVVGRYYIGSHASLSHGVGARNTDTIFYSSTDNFIRKNNASSFRTSLDVYSKAEVNALAGDNLGAGGTTTGSLFSTNASSTIGRDTNDFIRFDDNAQAFWQINGQWEYQFYPTNFSAYTNNVNDLGTTSKRWKDGWFAGVVTAGSFAGNGAAITAINGDNITDNTIDGSEIQDNTLTANDLAANSVGASEIATNAVTNAKILSVSNTKLTGIPVCSAANQALQWNGSSFTCRTLSFSAPHSHPYASSSHSHDGSAGSPGGDADTDEALEDIIHLFKNKKQMLISIEENKDKGILH